MKFSFTIGLLSTFALVACEVDEPPPHRGARPQGKYPQTTANQYPAQPQPFQEGAPQTTPPTSAPQGPTTADENASAPQPSAAPKAKGDYPYAVPVPGKPGFVHSPFTPDKMIDVRGYAPGTEVKDPYHPDKIFLVP